MSKKLLLSLFLVFVVSLPVMPGPVLADGPLNEPPPPPGYNQPAGNLAPVLGPNAIVDPQNRAESSTFYQTGYPVPASVTIGWTGNHTTCDPGATSQAFQEATLQRVNYFRNMAGLPSVILSVDVNLQTQLQAAALMMSVNKSLSHNPPTSWKCYSADGVSGAASNLALGEIGWGAVNLHMQDAGGAPNILGHRRWILYPHFQEMISGDVPGGTDSLPAGALKVYIAGPRPTPRDEFVAWPPPGYVPYQVVFPNWSFSYPGANFSGATISMTRNGASLDVTNLNSHTVDVGENTLGWTPKLGLGVFDPWPKPKVDTVYTVNITNVIINGSPRNFSYQVIIFDPATDGSQTIYLPLISK